MIYGLRPHSSKQSLILRIENGCYVQKKITISKIKFVLFYSRFNFKDHVKEASQAEISQDCRYTAVFDEQNRVLLIDNASGLIINVWKGKFF